MTKDDQTKDNIKPLSNKERYTPEQRKELDEMADEFVAAFNSQPPADDKTGLKQD